MSNVELETNKPTSKVVAATSATAITGALTALLVFAFKLPPGVAESITILAMTAGSFVGGYLKKSKVEDTLIKRDMRNR